MRCLFLTSIIVAACLATVPEFADGKSKKKSLHHKKRSRSVKSPVKKPGKKRTTKKKRSGWHWPVAAGLKAGLAATPLPALGMGIQTRFKRALGAEVSWTDGSISPDASAFYSVPDAGWNIDDLTIRGTRFNAEGRWFISKYSWLGFGFYQKNLTVRLSFGSSGSGGSTRFNIVGSLLSRGLSFSLGSQWLPFKKGLLEIQWLGIDWPLWSEMIIEGGNNTLAVSVDESFFDGQDQTRQLISSLRSFPLPSLFIAGFSYIFY